MHFIKNFRNHITELKRIDKYKKEQKRLAKHRQAEKERIHLEKQASERERRAKIGRKILENAEKCLEEHGRHDIRISRYEWRKCSTERYDKYRGYITAYSRCRRCGVLTYSNGEYCDSDVIGAPCNCERCKEFVGTDIHGERTYILPEDVI